VKHRIPSLNEFAAVNESTDAQAEAIRKRRWKYGFLKNDKDILKEMEWLAKNMQALENPIVQQERKDTLVELLVQFAKINNL